MLDKLKNEGGRFLRDIVFGVNDAILTNLGIVAGFSASLQDKKFVVMAALVDIFISAFAMCFGTYMSRISEEDFLRTKLSHSNLEATEDAIGNPIIASIVMWFAYVVAGFIPVFPFFLGLSIATSLKFSFTFGLISFFILGAIKGTLTKTKIVSSGLTFLAFGTVSAIIGLIIGNFASSIK